MHKDARDCIERATECARLAESVEHPELKLYLEACSLVDESGN
jgi:hypothetical protein